MRLLLLILLLISSSCVNNRFEQPDQKDDESITIIQYTF